ncbi:MAG: hypothetical protein ACFFCZ_08130 [Promethearchaeota archaeon]
MNIVEILFSALLWVLPIIIAIIPYLLFEYYLKVNPLYKSLYFRFMVGFLAVYIFYILVPSILFWFFGGDLIRGQVSDSVQLGDILFYEIFFFAQNIIFLFFSTFFLQIFPSIFGLSTILSFILLLIILRREPGGKLKEKLNLVTLSQEDNPVDLIKKNLLSPDWAKQKDLLKVILAILPISLLLITSILKLVGGTEDPFTSLETGFGWFTDVFFVYLASIIFCVQLLYSARVFYRGNFVGERLRNEMIRSVSTVGAFLSGVTLLFSFLEQINLPNYGTIPVTLFFLSYFIMASILFVLFLDIFEPISIYLLSKIIYFARSFDLSKIQSSITKTRVVNLGIMILIVLIVNFLSYAILYADIIWVGAIFGSEYYQILEQIDPKELLIPLRTLVDVYGIFALDLFIRTLFTLLLVTTVPFLRRMSKSIIVNALIVYLITTVISIFNLFLSDQYLTYNSVFGLFMLPYLPVIVFFSDLAFLRATETVFTTYSTSIFVQFNMNGLVVLLPRLTNLIVGGNENILVIMRYIAYPHVLFYPFFVILFFGAILSLFDVKFRVHSIHKDQIVERNIFSSTTLPVSDEVLSFPNTFLLAINKTEAEKRTFEQESLASVVCEILHEGPALISEIKDEIEGVGLEELYTELVKLTFEDEQTEPLVSIYREEYGYAYEEAALDSLHVMMTDGRSVFAHDFGAESEVDPVLIAGLFSAITSFSREATRSEQFLRTIDHGDVVLIIEYGQWCFSAVIADRQTAVLRSKLRKFLDDFEERYKTVLPNWLGDLGAFEGSEALVEANFQ